MATSDFGGVARHGHLGGVATDDDHKQYPLFLSGLSAARPAPESTRSGAMYFATDTGELSVDVGNTWQPAVSARPTFYRQFLFGGSD